MDNHSKKILLIEDEFFIADLYQRILVSHGFEVEVAADGEAGLELAKNKPDLILLDVMLPKLNGIEVLKKLKADRDLKDITVILLTNLSQSEVIKQLFEFGASGYFLKARIKPEELVAVVKKFLDNPSLKMDFNSLSFD